MKSKVLPHDANKVKEKFFSSGMEILRPVKYMVADSYPFRKREPSSPEYDAVIKDEFDKANKRAQFLLYEQRNIVQDRWLPRYDVTYVSRPHETEDWKELKSLLVDGCLDRLAELLIANSPIIVAKDYVEPVQQAILKVVEVEKQKLTEYLRSFHVVRKPGIPTISEDYV